MALTEKFDSKKDFKTALKRSTKKSSGLFRRFKDGERCSVRFLTEMDKWERAGYHWLVGSDGKPEFSWCSKRKSCEGCKSGDDPKFIHLANALVRADGKVQILQISASIAEMLNKKDDSAGTICDRDYIISREGTSLNDTKYFLDWDERSKFNSSRYQIIDIERAILTELGLNDDDGEEDDDTEDDYSDLDRSELKAELKKFIPGFVAKKSQTDEDLLDLLRKTTSNFSEDEDEQDDEWDDEEEEDLNKSRPAKKKVASKSSSSAKRVIRRS